MDILLTIGILLIHCCHDFLETKELSCFSSSLFSLILHLCADSDPESREVLTPEVHSGDMKSWVGVERECGLTPILFCNILITTNFFLKWQQVPPLAIARGSFAQTLFCSSHRIGGHQQVTPLCPPFACYLMKQSQGNFHASETWSLSFEVHVI